MRWGMWTSSAWGDVEDMILDLGPPKFAASMGLLLASPIIIAPGYGNRYWGAYIDGQKKKHDFIEEGTPYELSIPVIGSDESIGFHMEDLGDWATWDYDPFYNAQDFEAKTSEHITMEWTATPSIEEAGDTFNQLASWSFGSPTTLKRFSNIAKVAERPTWGLLRVLLVDVAGTRTVSVYSGDLLIAQGSRVGDGVIILSQMNNSGVVGSVVVTYVSNITLGTVTLTERWPASYQIHYSTSPLIFPRTPEALLDDDGNSNRFGFTTELLPPGTYNLAILAISDTGKVDTATAAVGTRTILSPPGHPFWATYYRGGAGYGTGNILLSPTLLAPASWTKIDVAVVDGSIAGPDGLLSGSKLTESGIPSFTDHYVQQIISITIGLTYQIYAIGKAGAFDTYARVEFNDGIFLPSVVFDLVGGTYTLLSGVLASDTISPVNLGNGWWLFGFKRVAAATTAFSTYRYKIHSNSAGFNIFTNPFAYGYHFRSQVEVAAAPHFPTVIRFTAPDGTSSFDIYDSPINKPVNQTVPVIVEPAAVGEHFVLMPSTSPDTGSRLILVRTVNVGGTEEKNSSLITVEYLSNLRVNLRPNSPFVKDIVSEAAGGLTVIVTAVYDNFGAKGLAVKIQLFVQSDALPIDYTSIQATGDLPLLVNGRGEVDITYVVGVAGFYNVAIRAASLDGTTDLGTVSKRVYLSGADPQDVVNFDTRVARG